MRSTYSGLAPNTLGAMAETYDSVVDRIGAFNAATESMSKARVREVRMDVRGHSGLRLRLAKSAENYAIEIHGAPASAAEALQGMGFAAQGEVFARQVRKPERSWDVASQLEDILSEALGLPPDVVISVETETSP